jgi:hypothetical protein
VEVRSSHSSRRSSGRQQTMSSSPSVTWRSQKALKARALVTDPSVRSSVPVSRVRRAAGSLATPLRRGSTRCRRPPPA